MQQIIKPDQLELVALIVFNSEKGGFFCFCVDEQKLETVTKRDSYPILCMGEVHRLPLESDGILYPRRQ